ncbi:MAG: response regulator transcription factor [Ignavibacteriaceae bacterium]|nr:response regulator transcription factor [Ignavibacteriaceae bacterium]
MIVDDNPAMRQMIREFCAPYFNHIEECSNGKEAVEFFAAYLPQLVIMDIKMPVMGGIDATKAILKNHPQARIIVTTQCNEVWLKDEAAKAGAYLFLPKDRLFEIVNIFSKREIK